MRSELSIEVAASPARVFELARDIGAWPKLLPHYRKVTVQSHLAGVTTARMTAVRRFGPLALPVTWRAEQSADATDPLDLQFHFRHIGGWTKGMDVAWHIRPAGDGTGARVSIEHVFSRRLPLVGSDAFPRFVDRFFVKPIASRTLATFKRLAEAR